MINFFASALTTSKCREINGLLIEGGGFLVIGDGRLPLEPKGSALENRRRYVCGQSPEGGAAGGHPSPHVRMPR